MRAALLVTLCCAGRAAAEPPAEQIADLVSLATGHGPAAELRARLASGATNVDALIDELVRSPELARVVAPQVLLGYLNVPPIKMGWYALSRMTVDGVDILYAKRPCPRADAVEVAPWWAPASKVRICRDDYRPTVLRDHLGNVCSGVLGFKVGAECGCGPALINCTRDEAHRTEVLKSLQRETTRTIAYVVEHDLPLSDIFTTSASFRDKNAETAYVRDRVYEGLTTEVPDLSSWPAEGKWAPREELWPGQQAGILTDKHYAYMTDGPRDRMKLYYDRAWCKAPSSFGVDIAVFKKLLQGSADLRSKPNHWQDIAATPGCTTCHARLDYGMQFFAGYPSTTISMTPTRASERHTEVGPLYGNDIGDLRGQAALTPRAFAQLLVAADDFRECMIGHVERHVLGVATNEERAVLRDELVRTGRFRPLFAAALRLYVARRPEPPPAAAAAGLTGLLAEHCGDCHSGEGKLGFLDRPLDRDRLLRMANLLSSGLMPKTRQPLPAETRRAVLEALIATLSPSAAWSANAKAYWVDRFRGSRVLPFAALRRRIAEETGAAPADGAPVIDEQLEGDLLTLTPNAIFQAGRIAAESCAQVPADRRLDCVTNALRPDVLLVR